MEIDEVNKLSSKRREHSIGVMKMCEKLAQIYGADIEKAKLIGMAHDIAKEMPKDEKISYMNLHKLPINEYEKMNPDILHGKIAADICKNKYEFDDEMCEAISNHTTGKPEMTLLQKILFVADKIDETRNYEGLEELRKIAYSDLDEAILYNIDETIKINIKKRKIIFIQSIETRNFILKNKIK